MQEYVIKIKFIPWREHKYYLTFSKLGHIFQQIATHLKSCIMFRLGNIGGRSNSFSTFSHHNKTTKKV